jgi:hypothetical protein
MPPDLCEWLPEGHLAWFVIEAVEEMDLGVFYGAYRRRPRGRPPIGLPDVGARLASALAVPQSVFGDIPDVDVPTPAERMDVAVWLEVYLDG